MTIKSIAKRLYAASLWTRVGMRVRWRQPPAPPSPAPPENAILQDRAEWEAAVQQLRRRGLPLHFHRSKNWDTLAALGAIVRHIDRSGTVLDAGSALYSTLLPALWRYGYQRLTGINLEFRKPLRRGPAQLLPGDLTATSFDQAAFDAISCLSVVEHGVDLTAYFKEASRLLRPGGILVTSTDFSYEPIDTAGLTAYGVPVRIFTPDEIKAALATAADFGLEPTGALDFHRSSAENPVTWKRMGLRYTFIVFTLRKQAA
jgi:SAM-dependent methyltransferase